MELNLYRRLRSEPTSHIRKKIKIERVNKSQQLLNFVRENLNRYI